MRNLARLIFIVFTLLRHGVDESDLRIGHVRAVVEVVVAATTGGDEGGRDERHA